MSVENPKRLLELSSADDDFFPILNSPWKISIKKLQDSLRKSEKIPQKESQKIEQISQVLFVLYNMSMNTTQIKNKSKLSWGSVNRTMKLLREKKIVTMKQKKDKKNNEKIYTLKNNEAITYHIRLCNWKISHSKYIRNKLMESGKNNKNRLPNIGNLFQIRKYLPPGWRDLKIRINKKESEEFEIISLSHNLYAPYIMLNYVMGKYCYECFHDGFISIIVFDGFGNTFCPRCGREGKFVDEFPLIRMREKDRIRFDVDKEIYKILHNAQRS